MSRNRGNAGTSLLDPWRTSQGPESGRGHRRRVRGAAFQVQGAREAAAGSQSAGTKGRGQDGERWP